MIYEVCLRTFQDSNGEERGFSAVRASDLRVPVISKGEYSYRNVNVAEQQRDPKSFLNWMGRAIRTRSQCPEFGKRRWDVIRARDPSVLALRYVSGEGAIMAIHNLAPKRRRIGLARAARGYGTPRAVWQPPLRRRASGHARARSLRIPLGQVRSRTCGCASRHL